MPARDRTAGAAWITRAAAPIVTADAPGDGELVGLRFAVKDNIAVAGLPTTAACPRFARTPTAHAEVVRRLLAAGAACVGKTNLDQFACGLNGTRSPYGAVPNSFDPRYVSGGSSSGSAYAVATGQVDFALGTDTAGSGRVPAGLNNIVGVKPSRGLISASGVVPAAQSVDCVSIFAPTIALGARVLRAAIGHDPDDPFSRTLPLAPATWPARFRFGVPDAPEFFGDRQAQAGFAAAVARLAALGGTPVTIDYQPLADAAGLLYDSALVAERYAAIREFFDADPTALVEPVRSVIARGRDYRAADFVDAQVRLRALGQRAAAIWSAIDVLVVPTAPTHYTIDAMRESPVELNRRLGFYTNFVNLLDYAALSVPSDIRADGLPFGITMIAGSGSDFALLALGSRYHHATGLTRGATGEPLGPAVPLVAPPPSSRAATALSGAVVTDDGVAVDAAAAGVAATGACAGDAAPSTVRVAVVGAHLSGMPLNGQLLGRGARLVATTRTAPLYRLYALAGTVPPKPGLVRVAPGDGAAIEIEVWQLDASRYGSFVAAIPPPLGIGTLLLEDGSSVQGFVCEGHGLAGATDITGYGGWRRYLAPR
ncbi:MAG: allophanate hydrolase [Lautropia sp.]